MGIFTKLLILGLITVKLSPYFCEYACNSSYKWPTVVISILVRNKALTLPYFFSCLMNLDYPKDRIYIWIYSDFNEDNSIEIIEDWVNEFGSAYNGVLVTTNATNGPLHPDEKSSTSSWSQKHFEHVIQLRESAVRFARRIWADFIFMLDADAFLTDPTTLKYLVNKDMVVVAPMLVTDGLFANFWGGMTEQFYYSRTDEYKLIYYRNKVGCFNVPMVHSAVLISLRYRKSDALTYNPENIKGYVGPIDDIIVFALNAIRNGIPLYICNDHHYGFMTIPLEDDQDRKYEHNLLLNVKMQALGQGTPLLLDKHFEGYITYPKKSKYGCSEIFLINLERRPERLKLMALSFKELGLEAKLFKAIDGKHLDVCNLKEDFITLMPEYEDPYHKRPMKAGEVGCFLSHYYIWEQIVEERLDISLVLEDDVHFVPYFRQHFYQLMEEIKALDWDFVYLGRKLLSTKEEPRVAPHVVRPFYSYWTIGYLITQRGAQKLLDANPLDKLLPIDEFLPIMFDQHDNTTWTAYYPHRNLKAFSADPLLIYPTHYTGEEGYISDTEDSVVVKVKEPGRIRNEL